MEEGNLPAFIGAIIGAVITGAMIIAMGFIIIAFMLVK